MKTNIFLLLVGIALFPAGCTMTPKYVRPTAPIPAAWPTGEAYTKSRVLTNSSEATNLRWREFFVDQKLQQLIEVALTNNRDLVVSVINVDKTRAQDARQRGGPLPTDKDPAGEKIQRATDDLSA